MEHWLPLFFGGLETLFDYFDDGSMIFDHLAREAISERHRQIEDHYEARHRALEEQDAKHDDGSTPYKPVPIAALYITADEMDQQLAGKRANFPFAI